MSSRSGSRPRGTLLATGTSRRPTAGPRSTRSPSTVPSSTSAICCLSSLWPSEAAFTFVSAHLVTIKSWV